MKARLVPVLLAASVVGTTIAQDDSAPTDYDVYSNFHCAALAEEAEMLDAALRHFEKGYPLAVEWAKPYVEGRRTVERGVNPSAVIQGLVLSSGLKGPIPSAEFVAGRVYQATREMTFNQYIGNEDGSLPREIDGIRIRAEARYSEYGCAERLDD